MMAASFMMANGKMVKRPEDKDLLAKYKIRGYFEWKGLPFCSVHYLDRLEVVEDYQFGRGDVLMSTYPKSGTNFATDLMFDIMRMVGRPFVNQRMYSLEVGEMNPEIQNASPKLVYSHLPWSHLPKQAREGKVQMVTAVRNPKAICTSFYAFLKEPIHFTLPLFEPANLSMDEFIDEMFTNGRMAYGDYFGWLRQWYDHRNDEHLLTLRFDDLKDDTRSCILKLCSHLDVTLSVDQIDRIVEKNQFARRKKEEKDAWQQIILRNGEVDGWKNELTEEQISRLDDWISKSIGGLDDYKI